MTKPQFGVVYTPGASDEDGPTATIAVTYVADLDHRYVINISPSWLTTSGLDVNLGPEGQLISINSNVTSTVTPVLQTVAKLAGALVAFGAFDISSSHEALSKEIEKESEIADSSDPPNTCLRGDTHSESMIKRSSLSDAQKHKVQKPLAERIRLTNVAERSRELHFLNDEEFRLLKAVRCRLEKDFDDAKKELIKDKDLALTKLPKEKAARVTELVNQSLAGAELKARVVGLARLRSLAEADPTINDVLSKTTVLATKKPPAALEIAKMLVEMSPTEWQRRRLLSIQREIESRQWQLARRGCAVPSILVAPATQSTVDCNSALDALNAAKGMLAGALGRRTDYRLASKFDEQLVSQAAGPKDIDPQTYQRLRAARNAAITDIETAKQAVLKEPARPTPVTTKTEAAKMLNATGKEKEADSSWVLQRVVEALDDTSINLPEIVVVIDKGQ